MNEEEIIEIIEELQCEYKEQENENKYNDYTFFKAKRYSKGLQGLLDLYNKEKQKNECLEDTLNNSIDIRKYWISKDKIKEKIEEIKKDENPSISSFQEYAQEYSINKLQELLEERN